MSRPRSNYSFGWFKPLLPRLHVFARCRAIVFGRVTQARTNLFVGPSSQTEGRGNRRFLQKGPRTPALREQVDRCKLSVLTRWQDHGLLVDVGRSAVCQGGGNERTPEECRNSEVRLHDWCWIRVSRRPCFEKTRHAFSNS